MEHNVFKTGVRSTLSTIRLTASRISAPDQGVRTMMAMVQLVVFVGALALVLLVLAETVAPALPRMAMLLRGEADPAGAQAFTPRVRSEEHTSELQSLMRISYAVFCLKKKQKQKIITDIR